eukprot:CAMPEP_0175039818 /NCGR_PEP_ID=MMETSP0052_2-20121109/855_1 /TAXON_ID=51329 ORGANISM="Polytomella parva, Strain SAG 63-3" /NCGR_SAMPLE_ID=MMETSP0052_2 /ASSEMBLY_ACC=CAM_ASM_000194 /LENGTH=50 /DNA_ID=CAMNT_0016301833 /DNA_START=1297 /DNA_END=1449 /DNA_ORIENTATION=+
MVTFVTDGGYPEFVNHEDTEAAFNELNNNLSSINVRTLAFTIVSKTAFIY